MTKLNWSWLAGCACVSLMASQLAYAQGENYYDFSLEDLTKVKIQTASKREQKVIDTAAAVYVLTSEEMKRLGANTIPDALRVVPGLMVGQEESGRFAVGSRSFNGLYDDKLLVLVDGRTVYSPTHAGVFWESLHIPMEEIDRIEVIRGPGGAIWGANAVDGVINIVTKSSKDTKGTEVVAGGGNQMRQMTYVRYGDTIGEDGSYRVFGNYNEADDLHEQVLGDLADGWHDGGVGFRFDLQPCADDKVLFEGSWNGARSNTVMMEPIPMAPYFYPHRTPIRTRQVYTLARWEQRQSAESDTSLQFYYSNFNRDEPILGQDIHSYDVEFNQHLTWLDNNILTWGVHSRMVHDSYQASRQFSIDPATKTYLDYDIFGQNELALFDKQLFLTLGAKLGHNDFSGFEVQPTARALWKITGTQSLWGAVSRAVHTPSRAFDGLDVTYSYSPGELPGQTYDWRILGNRDLGGSDVISYEVGYRAEPTSNMNVSLATFYNHYTKLSGFRPSDPYLESLDPFIVGIPLELGNIGTADSIGFEADTSIRLMNWWRVKAAYTYLNTTADYPEGTDGGSTNLVGTAPTNQFSVSNDFDLPWGIQASTVVRYVSDLNYANVAGSVNIDPYFEMDQYLAYKVNKSLEFSVAGRNLLNRRHTEFYDRSFDLIRAQIGREVYGQVTLRY